MKKIFRKYIFLILSAAIIPILIINFFLTVFTIRDEKLNTFTTKLEQIIHTMEENQTELDSIKSTLNEDYLTRARAAAYVIEQNPDLLKETDELKNLAGLLEVDELHIINKNGVIEYSSVPKYIGLDFHKGKQTQEFLSILSSDNPDAYIVQEAQPNAAENKMMKYVGVSRKSKKGIIQVGLEPVRLMEAQEKNTYNSIFSKFPTDVEEDFFAIDCTTDEVIGHSDGISKQILGSYYTTERLQSCNQGGFKKMESGDTEFIVTKKYENVLIGISVPCNVLFRNLGKTLLQTLCFLLIIQITIILLLNYLIQKKVIAGIHSILYSLDDISNGNLDTTVNESGNPEFEALSSKINTMVKSIVNSSARISKIIEISGIPLAAFEYQEGMNQVFFTSKLNELLNLTPEETRHLSSDSHLFLQMIRDIMENPLDGETTIFGITRQKYVRIHLSQDENGYLGVVTDATKSIIEKRKMQYENNHDQLTGLSKYQYFQYQAGEILRRMPTGEICACVMLDLDSFKSINDTFGHDAGDIYLKNFATLLHNLPKEHCLAARRSGDEFCMMIFHYTDKNEVMEMLHTFWESLSQNPVTLSDTEQRFIQVSGGFVCSDNPETRIEDLLRHADEALYHAKNTNKGTYEEYLSY